MSELLDRLANVTHGDGDATVTVTAHVLAVLIETGRLAFNDEVALIECVEAHGAGPIWERRREAAAAVAGPCGACGKPARVAGELCTDCKLEHDCENAQLDSRAWDAD